LTEKLCTVPLGKAFCALSKILKKKKPDLFLTGIEFAAKFKITVFCSHMNIPVKQIQGGEIKGTINESLWNRI